jgi:Multicopper oxidase
MNDHTQANPDCWLGGRRPGHDRPAGSFRTGKSVFHCHFTPHEDVGMMQNFLILGPAQAGHKH